jgi:hypothetical protein
MVWHEKIDSQVACPPRSFLYKYPSSSLDMKSVRENVSSVPRARRISNAYDPLVQFEGKSVLLFRVCQHSVPANGFDLKIVTMV